MITRKLTSWQEWLEAERINSISFLHTFDKEKVTKKQRKNILLKHLDIFLNKQYFLH